jgi:hypothetical protein
VRWCSGLGRLRWRNLMQYLLLSTSIGQPRARRPPCKPHASKHSAASDRRLFSLCLVNWIGHMLNCNASGYNFRSACCVRVATHHHDGVRADLHRLTSQFHERGFANSYDSASSFDKECIRRKLVERRCRTDDPGGVLLESTQVAHALRRQL